MNTSTCLADAMSAIVTSMRATAGYQSCWSTGIGVPVYHSAEAGLIGDHPVTCLIIGDTGDFSGVPDDSGDSSQSLATLGTLRHRSEDAVIRCRAVAVTGDSTDGSIQATWADAVGIVDDVDTMLRGSGSLGLVPAYRSLTAVMAGVSGIRPYLSAGVVVEVLFDIAITARI